MPTLTIPTNIRAIIGDNIQSQQTLRGGSVSHTIKITTRHNNFVLKHGQDLPTDIYHAEAEALNTLASSNAFHTPEIVSVTEQWLLMRFVASDVPKDWEKFAAGLAILHQQQHTHYGFANNNYFATLLQQNQWQIDWLSFYREQRLRPLIHQTPLTIDDQQRLEKLLDKLDRYLDNSEPPTLIHGDLWDANIIFNQRGIFVIDPAAYYAPREIEIAYLEFVGDSHEALLQCYQKLYPLSVDYAERKNFYLLYPYLCHLKLYGESYLPGLRALLEYLV